MHLLLSTCAHLLIVCAHCSLYMLTAHCMCLLPIVCIHFTAHCMCSLLCMSLLLIVCAHCSICAHCSLYVLATYLLNALLFIDSWYFFFCLKDLLLQPGVTFLQMSLQHSHVQCLHKLQIWGNWAQWNCLTKWETSHNNTLSWSTKACYLYTLKAHTDQMFMQLGQVFYSTKSWAAQLPPN